MNTAMKVIETTQMRDEGAFFAPHIKQVKDRVIQNRVIEALPAKLRNAIESGGTIKDSDVPLLLQHASEAEEWLEICFLAEQSGTKPEEMIENLWVAGLEKFSGSSAYLESLGYFFYQKGIFHKSLNYLSKANALGKSFFALTLSMVAAYAVTQYHLVIDYYNALSKNDREKLDEDIIMKVATAALHRKDYQLSQNLFTYIREKNEAPPLPSLEETMMERFGSMSKLKNWVNEMAQKTKAPGQKEELSLTDCITYASALMHLNQFDQALEHMEAVKNERFMSA